MPNVTSLPALKLAVLGPATDKPLMTVPRYSTWVDARWTTPTAARFAEAYRANSAFHACVVKLGDAFVEPPLRAYTVGAGGAETARPDSPLQALLDHPNPDQGQREWLRSCITKYAWGGNAYLNKVPATGGGIAELWPLSARVMAPACPDGTITTGYWHTADPANPVLIAKNRIAHWAGNEHPLRPWEGISPVEVLLREIDADDELARLLKAMLQNDAVPRGVLSLPPDANPSEKELTDMKARWQAALGRGTVPDALAAWGYAGYGGAVSGVGPFLPTTSTALTDDGRGGVAILTSGATYQRTALDMTELGADSVRHNLEARIHAIMGVLPQVTGVYVGLVAGRYANFAEAFRAFIEGTMVGHWLDFESVLNHEIAPAFGPEWRIHFDQSRVRALADNEDAIHVRDLDELQKGAISLNEWREKRKYKKLADPAADAHGTLNSAADRTWMRHRLAVSGGLETPNEGRDAVALPAITDDPAAAKLRQPGQGAGPPPAAAEPGTGDAPADVTDDVGDLSEAEPGSNVLTLGSREWHLEQKAAAFLAGAFLPVAEQSGLSEFYAARQWLVDLALLETKADAPKKGPGARGGQYWIDAHGKVRYGKRPVGRHADPAKVAARAARKERGAARRSAAAARKIVTTAKRNARGELKGLADLQAMAGAGWQPTDANGHGEGAAGRDAANAAAQAAGTGDPQSIYAVVKVNGTYYVVHKPIKALQQAPAGTGGPHAGNVVGGGTHKTDEATVRREAGGAAPPAGGGGGRALLKAAAEGSPDAG